MNLCDYCINHGHGKKWYMNARNVAKDLARSAEVKDFCESYFSREITPQKHHEPRTPLTFTPVEQQAVDQRYRKYLHHQVVSTEEAVSILQMASLQTDEHERAVVLLPCICRYVVHGSDPGRHCFGIAFTDEYTRRFPKYLGGGHRYVSAEVANDILNEMVQQEPIVHAISAMSVPYLGILCNCEMPVCGPYLRRLRFGITSPYYKGHYRGKVDAHKCSGCGTCEQSCPFAVAKVNPVTNSSEIDQNSCFGCGVCMRNCPDNAIYLTEVDGSARY